MKIGSAWYPEHWPKSRWKRDLELMKEAHFNVVRVGEFAWSSMEPEPGRYELDWLAEAVDLAHAEGLEVVLCTPTPTPPAWLVRQYPDILAVRDFKSGEIQPHGQRGHVDPSNEDYRRATRGIVQAMAERFSAHPGVIGWQTDNEFWSIPQNPSALEHFRRWCVERYGSLHDLNEAWSTSFWSQTYFAPEDIQPPYDYPNPALWLAWYRWASELTREYQLEQIEILREHCPSDHFITHNFHPFDDLDRACIAEDLDLISWDAYIMGDQLTLDPGASGHDMDRLRCLGNSDRALWVMETLPGFVNWRHINRHFEPGETRTMGWHLVGHGADAVLYWQWRSAPANQEQYHGNLIQQDGEPRPVYYEIAAFGAELKNLTPHLQGTRVYSDIAIIDRWDDRQALKRQPHHTDYDPRMEPVNWSRSFRQLGHNVDVLDRIPQELHHQLVVAPQLYCLDAASAQALMAWVEAGGHLVIGPRFARKNSENALQERRQPGPFRQAAGLSVEEYYSLPSPIALEGKVKGHARTFAERLQVESESAAILASYGPGNGWLEGRPALVQKEHGKGKITTCAFCPDADFLESLLPLLMDPCPPRLPEGVERCTRRKEDRTLTIHINHTSQPQRIPAPSGTRLRGPEAQDQQLLLSPYDISLFESQA